MLEVVLVANPDMLMRGLTLVGRQVPVETGYVDLLGIDEDGRLVVFELKREKLTRDAVAQILDYCTYLEALSDSELATLLAERRGFLAGQAGWQRAARPDEPSRAPRNGLARSRYLGTKGEHQRVATSARP